MCEQGPYIVFFDWDEANISPEAATVLEQRDYGLRRLRHGSRSCLPVTLTVPVLSRTTWAWRSVATNRSRITSPVAAFRQPAITSQSFGESMPRVATADGVRELQNRRVEITYGPGSGM